MLLKVLILTIIVWLVIRTILNLLRAVASGEEERNRRERSPGQRSTHRSGYRKVLHRRRNDSGDGSRSPESRRDVEEARFRDL